jgi:RNA polymerase sigma-70 factor (ECF subfamily)
MSTKEFNSQLSSMNEHLERFALSLTGNREDAMDLTQETYLKALSNRNKYTDYTNFKAWVFTIMRNTFINNYRRSVRENTTFDNTADLYYLSGSQSTSAPTPEAEYSAEEIYSAIDRLEDEFRLPFKMHHDGYKYKEIADELDLKIGTVKSRIFFSRKKLMEALVA